MQYLWIEGWSEGYPQVQACLLLVLFAEGIKWQVFAMLMQSSPPPNQVILIVNVHKCRYHDSQVLMVVLMG